MRPTDTLRLCTLLGTVLMLVLTSVAALAQAPPCPSGGSGLVTPSTLGGGILDGRGVGAVSLGASPSDVERVWGLPENCAPQKEGYAYNYFLTEDGGQTGWLVAVVFVDSKAAELLVTAVPHGRGPGPKIQTARGVGLFDSADEVRRRYGAPGSGSDRYDLYVSDGIAFSRSRGLVGAIHVFRPGTTPAMMRP